MKTIKQFFYFVSLLCVMICVNSCSEKEDVLLNPSEMNQSVDEAQESEMKELISFIEVLNSNQIQVRGRFWDRIKQILIGDAYGFGWGVNHGFNAQGGLITAAVFSIVVGFTARQSSSATVWRLNSDWKVYNSPIRDYEKIGNDHNRVIYELMKNDPTIANGTFTNDYLCGATNKKLMSYGYADGMSVLQKTTLVLMVDKLKKCTTVQELQSLIQRESPQFLSEFLFVDNYVNGIAGMSDKQSVRSYTQRINDQIDSSSLGGAAISRLKTMVAIAENSKALWIEVE